MMGHAAAGAGVERECEEEPREMAEGVGFEPTVGLTLLSISSRVPLTTQPPFQLLIMRNWRRS